MGSERAETKTFHVPREAEGARLDRWLSAQLPELSRRRLQGLIREGHVRVDGKTVRKPGASLRAGSVVELALPPPERVELEPEPMSLEILYEDDDVVVVHKPAGLVVHPAAGHEHGTLVQGLLAGRRLAPAGGAKRPGVVHRLDKATSGALVLAKTDRAYYALVEQFKARRVKKIYLALVHGLVPEPQGEVEGAIGRDPRHRERMAIKPRSGKPALTRFRVRARLPEEGTTLLEIYPHTGRTHQIRVHLSAIGHPVVGDPVYGPRPPRAKRLMLHAWVLGFLHPRTGEWVEVTAPPPPEFRPYLERVEPAPLEPEPVRGHEGGPERATPARS